MARTPASSFRQRGNRARANRTRAAGGGTVRDIATLNIRRSEYSTGERWQRFDVPFEPGQSVLDGLRWIQALRTHGELHEIAAEVDWNIEIGTIMRLAQGPGTGKALLFTNVKDYNRPASRCRRIFGSALNSYRRIALMLGLPPDTHPRE